MERALVIELRGVEFINKGAELMLHALIEKTRTRFPNAIFVMQNILKHSTRQKHREYGILTKTSFVFKRYQKVKVFANFSEILDPLSFETKLSLGYVSEKDINVIFDASGFAFGDQWGAAYAGKVLADKIQKWKQQGKQIILMPQAFGPFKKPDLIDKMSVIEENSDLVFARDPISYKYMMELFPGNSKIVMSPDFTNLIKGVVPDYFNKDEHEVAIIPNFKMISATDKEKGDKYLSMLKNIITILREKNKKPYFLIHEGYKDAQLAKDLNSKFFKTAPLAVLIDDNPLAVKGMIGASQAVVTARFHGLVSALAQAIPCLATGWSHKYQMLLEDYSNGEALLDVSISYENLEERINSITDIASVSNVKRKLAEEALIQKQRSEDTWKLIFSMIEKKN